jgi:large subunit ribosomal protein L18
MNRLQLKSQNLKRRKSRVKKTIISQDKRPRLCVVISNKNVSAQIIDDIHQKTIISVSSANSKIEGNLTQKAEQIGVEIAKKAKAKKIKKIVFDRNGKLYHGRVKALADKAREGGLEF